VALVGTTASGKSALAIEAARRHGGVEIISVDSMAVYREMDLATAKPSPAERAAVPHHLLDVLDPAEDCSASLFQSLALSAIADVRARRRIPLLVGGTGLYHRAVIDELEIPPQFDELREALEVATSGPAQLAERYGELERLDPVAASRIEPSNRRRILRALEVTEGTGRPFSSFGPGLEAYGPSTTVQLGLAVEADVVDVAIDARFEAWMAGGLLAEVEGLARRPAGLGRTARQAIGYRELLAVVEESADLGAALEVATRRTRAFARRQRSWFRRDPRVAWCSPSEALETLLAAIEGVAECAGVGD
jgi:tRNA dimethylallyltransferase